MINEYLEEDFASCNVVDTKICYYYIIIELIRGGRNSVELFCVEHTWITSIQFEIKKHNMSNKLTSFSLV